MSHQVLLNVEHNPPQELIRLLVGPQAGTHFPDSGNAPFRVKQEEVIPRGLFNVVPVQLPFQVCLFFLVQVPVDVGSEEPVQLFFLEGWL